jgi:hypothetical protein
MTKSLVDIINKCKGKYQRYSKQDMFGFEQIITLTLQDINNNKKLKESHLGKHKGKYNTFGIGDTVKTKMGKAISKTEPSWQGQPDLDCDDPLYDGKQIR